MVSHSSYSVKIGFLMILSQAVLLGFTCHWIYSQYRNEERNLREDIETQLSDAKMQVMDSMLMTHLINPILADEKGFKMHVRISEDETFEAEKNQTKTIQRSIAFVDSPDSLIKHGLKPGDIHKAISLDEQSDSTNDLLVKGVKLIYDEVNSSNNGDIFEMKGLMSHTDTTLLKKIFSEKLKKRDINLSSHWISKESNGDSTLRSRTMYLESRLFPYEYGVEFSGYQAFLLKRISPQILFAIVLLLLTGTAFFISHRSLKNQMRLSELKNDFISNISHELKTPVSTVKVAIEALQVGGKIDNEKKVSEYLSIAALEINRLEQIINKVLDTSTLEGRKDLVQPEPLIIDELIREVLHSFQPRFAEKNASISFEAGEMPLTINADKLHVQGVLINLLDNSLKYSSDKPEIRIDLLEDAKNTIIKVSDNGNGIPPQYLDKVFEKFFRVPSLNIHNVKGSGLGLSYAALVMQQHKGSIEVENKKPTGSIFTLKFPKS